MNENVKQFIKDIGVLCETWTVIYRSFMSQGMTANEALKHTQAFMAATLESLTGKKNSSDN